MRLETTKGKIMSIKFEKEGRESFSLASPLVGTFLLGPLYFLICRAYLAAAIYAGITFITAGIGWLLLPFFSEMLLRETYKHQGWKEVPYVSEERERSEKGTIDIAITALLIGCVVSGGLVAAMLML
jgi:hypothetical protein